MLITKPSEDALNMASVDLDSLSKFSNIGEIGIGLDYSNNQLANEMQNQFPLLNWLMGTSVSQRWASESSQGIMDIHKDTSDGLFKVTMPWMVGTTPPEDMSSECCWIPLELQKCGGRVPLYMVCLKDCNPMMENMIYSNQRFQDNDMTNYFQRRGEYIKEARTRMAKLSMAWYSAHNFILGTSKTTTKTLKPFHGLLEVLEDSAVLHQVGSQILAAFDSLSVREAVIGTGGEVVYACHPLVYESLKRAVVPGQFGQLPAGWTNEGGELRFNGHRFIQDKMVPVDLTKGTGEIWVLDSEAVGIYLATDLIPTKPFIREMNATNDNRNDGCMTECTFYYNYGVVGATDSNKLAVVTDVPFSGSILGETLNGLDYIVTPQTIVPINSK